MANFKVISVDMFRTLADVDHLLKYERWQKVLGENYSPELAQKCQTHLDNSWNERFPRDKFSLQKDVLLPCFQDVFSIVPSKLSPFEATQLTVKLHGLSRPFNDSIPFLDQVGKQYPICLASDADEDLLGPLRNMCAFDHVFTSEQLRTYKGYADGRFFSAIVDYYGVMPEDIMHIGDERQEIVGAGKVGIITCWLNRHAKIWSDQAKPDFEVRSLVEVIALLGIDAIPG